MFLLMRITLEIQCFTAKDQLERGAGRMPGSVDEDGISVLLA